MKRRRGERLGLNVEPGFVHECGPIVGEIDEALLDRAGMKRDAGIDRIQADSVPGVVRLGREEMLLHSNQLHQVQLYRLYGSLA